MERLVYRSTSITHLQAELRRNELLRDADRIANERRARRLRRTDRRSRGLPLDLHGLIRRLAGS